VSDREGVQNSDRCLSPPDLVRASPVSCSSDGGSLAPCKLLLARGGAPATASQGVRVRHSSCSQDQARAPRARRHARRGVAVTELEPARPQGRASAAGTRQGAAGGLVGA